ncbi:MAG: type II secretion system protein N [Betaproteobacteria bacterium]|nr:type II secretion system protein N [Rhodocyclales bacterium]
MSPRILAAVFVLALFVALLVLAPARALAPVLEERSGHRLRLADARGSVWSGAAGLSCVLPEGTSVNCGRWGWNLVAENLAQGRLSLLVRREGVDESMLISWTAAGLEMEAVAITLPAALAGSLDPKIAALRLGGRLSISSQKLSGKAGQARISWQKMDSGLVPGNALGDHVIDVVNAPAGSVFTIASASGPVVLSGGGNVSPDGKVTIDAVARVDPKNAALPSLLSLMGSEFAPGQFRFRLP